MPLTIDTSNANPIPELPTVFVSGAFESDISKITQEMRQSGLNVQFLDIQRDKQSQYRVDLATEDGRLRVPDVCILKIQETIDIMRKSGFELIIASEIRDVIDSGGE